MANVFVFQSLILVLAALFFLTRLSAYMIKRKDMLFFLPLIILGLTFCFQSVFFYFSEASLSDSFQEYIAVWIYSFYAYLFYRRMKDVRMQEEARKKKKKAQMKQF